MQRRQLERADQAPSRGENDPERLIRLIDELRALDLERRRQPVSSAAFRDLARRTEAKAREVFQEAAGAPGSQRTAAAEARTRTSH